MNSETKTADLLLLKRSFDRKILTYMRWSKSRMIISRVKAALMTRSIIPCLLNDRSIYSYINEYAKAYALNNSIVNETEEIILKRIAGVENTYSWFGKLKYYSDKLKAQNAILIIQGSYADGQITNYSDIDLLIFYKPYDSNILEIKEEIEKLILKIDPLQHHGVFMLDINNLTAYWQFDLPLEALQRARTFGEEDVILPIKGVINENISSTKALLSTLNVMMNYIAFPQMYAGIWKLKLFLSQLMLLPTLLLASKGKYVYKGDSFTLAKHYYSKSAWHCLEVSTELRNQWPASTYFEEYSNLRESPLDVPSYEPIRINDLPSLNRLLNEEFNKSIKKLVNETEGILNV